MVFCDIVVMMLLSENKYDDDDDDAVLLFERSFAPSSSYRATIVR